MVGETAVDELIRLAKDPGVALDDLGRALGPALRAIQESGDATSMRRLVDEVVDAPTRPDAAGAVALACGALVEGGFDPTLALDAILDRLEGQVAPESCDFAAACREAAADEPGPEAGEGEGEGEGDDERPDPVESHGERVAALMPEQARSFRSLRAFSLAAIAMLSRSAESRAASRLRTSLRKSLDELGGQYGHAGELWIMMQVLDDEPLLILHPAQGKGYRVRISGLADNFQLHTLMADALVGRFSRRWLRGRRPAAKEAATARGGSTGKGEVHAHGSFNLWTWRGLRPDGTLPEPMESTHWIWNEGVPADIPEFEGGRVVLLGPPPYARSWNAVRKFSHMVGDLRLEAVLTQDEVRASLARIAAAVAAGA